VFEEPRRRIKDNPQRAGEKKQTQPLRGEKKSFLITLCVTEVVRFRRSSVVACLMRVIQQNARPKAELCGLNPASLGTADTHGACRLPAHLRLLFTDGDWAAAHRLCD